MWLGFVNFGEEGGLKEPKNFIAMYEAKLEFPERWGGGGGSLGKSLTWGGGGEYGYFLEPHIVDIQHLIL